MKTVPLHISPCPNDTFVFHAMIHGLVDTHGLRFDVTFQDIDQLNRHAIDYRASEPALIKVSTGVLDRIADQCCILPSGGAMGYGNGPLLVSRHKLYADELHDVRIAVPGLQTTANRLMDRLFPTATDKHPMLFSDIATAVMDGAFDAGVLIHEGRFTYRTMGLRLVADLGELWQEQFQMPIPLGAIVMVGETCAQTDPTRAMTDSTARLLSEIVRRSAEYALQNPHASADFVRSHARELDADVLAKHISYFVNDFTIDMADAGRQAIATLLGEEEAARLRFITL